MRDDLLILQAILRTLSQDCLADSTMARTIKEIANLTGWQSVSLLKPSGIRGELLILASAGSMPLPIGDTILDTSLMPAQDNATDTIQYVSDTAGLGSVFPEFRAIGSMIVAPLMSHGCNCATLLYTSDHANGFNERDLSLAKALRDTFDFAYRDAYSGIESISYLHTWMAFSSDGVILLDNELRVSMLNRPALNYLSLPGNTETWQRCSIWDLLKQMRTHAPDVVDQIVVDLQQIQAGRNEPTTGEFRLDLRVIYCCNLPVCNQQHQLGRILILRNVTENRILKELQENLTETLVSEIQTPLGHLAATLSSIAPSNGAQKLIEEDRHSLENALATTKDMLVTINEFVDMSRLESGQMPLSPSAFSFPDLVENVVQLEQPLAQERHLNLEKRVKESLPLTWGDRPLIQRVLQYIITNALKATPPGGCVQVEADVEPYGGDKIRVSISDTNQHSSRPALSRATLFAPQGSRSPGSTEPWMIFCHGVLEAHGERMWISHFDNMGITVTFTLPQVFGALTQLETSS